jgi:4-amino-4-deoxy-L-arabinose transferase-like glycosyltransferase
LLLSFAFLVRILFVFAIGIDKPPLEWADDFEYDRIAYEWVSDGTYTNTFYPVGYPFLLSIFYKIFDRNFYIIRVFQAFLGAATCIIIYFIGKKIVNERVGFLAALLLSIYPGHVYFSWRLMAEISFIFTFTIGILFTIRLLEKPEKHLSLLAGTTFGIANLFKNLLILFPFFLIVFMIIKSKRSIKGFAFDIGLFSSSFLLVLLINPLINFQVSGKEVIIPENVPFWLSNNPLANGYFISAEKYPEGKELILKYTDKDEYQKADRIQRRKILTKVALFWVRDNLGSFLILEVKKLLNAYGPFPRAAVFKNNKYAIVVHLLSYGILLPFMAAGLIHHNRNPQYKLFIILNLIFISNVIITLIFYGTPRYTLVIIPYLLIFASSAMHILYDFIRVKLKTII